MDTDNEAEVVAASRAGLQDVGDTEVLDDNRKTARSRDAITRKIRNPLSESRQAALPPRTPTPTPIVPPRIGTPSPRTPTPVSPPRSSTPSPRTPTPKPTALETAKREPLRSDSATVEVVPEALRSRPAEPVGATPAGPEPAGRLEHSGNIHLFSLVPAAPDGKEQTATAAKQTHKGLIVIAAVMVCGVAGNLALWRKSGDRGAVAQAVTAPSERRENPTSPREAPSVPALLPPTIAPLPEGCHVEITVQEAGAELLLDGSIAEGNQIKLDVPKDDKLHLVEASAPGFLPFKRSVTFSQDVYLTIALQRPGLPPKTRGPGSKVSKTNVTAGVKPEGKHADEQGMSSRSNATKRPALKIDEDDPYAP